MVLFRQCSFHAWLHFQAPDGPLKMQPAQQYQAAVQNPAIRQIRAELNSIQPVQSNTATSCQPNTIRPSAMKTNPIKSILGSISIAAALLLASCGKREVVITPLQSIVIGVGNKKSLADSFARHFSRHNTDLSTYNSIVGSPDFQLSPHARTVELVTVSGKDLGFAEDPSSFDVDLAAERANALGLDICPAEVGPRLALKTEVRPSQEGNVNNISGEGKNVTKDRHDTEEQAKAVCALLAVQGFAGERCHFPVRTWVEPVNSATK